jgi:hypothetical protein
MKKVFLLSITFILLISGCQLIPVLLPTPSALTPEFTNTPEKEGTALPVSIATITASPTPAQTATVSASPLPSITPTLLPYLLQPGSPAYIQNFAHTEADCNWLGIAGQVFDAENKTVNNLVVNVKGSLGQTEIDEIVLTGIPEADIYGPGGYEIKLADKAIDSENTLSIQVFDIYGKNLSKPVPFKTFSNCEKNLIIINFLMK